MKSAALILSICVIFSLAHAASVDNIVRISYWNSPDCTPSVAPIRSAFVCTYETCATMRLIDSPPTSPTYATYCGCNASASALQVDYYLDFFDNRTCSNLTLFSDPLHNNDTYGTLQSNLTRRITLGGCIKTGPADSIMYTGPTTCSGGLANAKGEASSLPPALAFPLLLLLASLL